jgi:peptidoglycan/LPS O-acetylase OafA/YrhL
MTRSIGRAGEGTLSLGGDLKIQSIQILRGWAAISVAANHIWAEGAAQIGPDSLFDTVKISSMAGMAVHIFFCISGMLMVLTLKEGASKSASAGAFIVNRIQRIYPIYIVWLTTFLVLGLIALALGLNFRRDIFDHLSPAHVIGNYLLLPGPSSDPSYRMYIPQAWTLVYEMYFYAMFAICVLFTARRHLILSLWLSIGGIFLLFHYGIGRGDRQGWSNATYMLGDRLIVNFLLGALFGEYIRRYGINPLSDRRKWLLIPVVALLFWIVLIWSKTPYVMNLSAITILIAVAYISVPVGRMSRVPVYLGEASYSIYVCHALVAFVTGNFLARHFLPPEAMGILLTVGGVVLGCLSYHFIEHPIDRHFRARRRAQQRAHSGKPAMDAAGG